MEKLSDKGIIVTNIEVDVVEGIQHKIVVCNDPYIERDGFKSPHIVNIHIEGDYIPKNDDFDKEAFINDIMGVIFKYYL